MRHQVSQSLGQPPLEDLAHQTNRNDVATGEGENDGVR